MQSMRLFEIGFKDSPRQSGYVDKFYIAGETAEDVIEKARQWMLDDHREWWQTDGRAMKIAELLDDEVKNWEEETDEWAERRIAENPALMAALSKAEEVYEADVANRVLAKVLDVGTLIV